MKRGELELDTGFRALRASVPLRWTRTHTRKGKRWKSTDWKSTDWIPVEFEITASQYAPDAPR